MGGVDEIVWLAFGIWWIIFAIAIVALGAGASFAILPIALAIMFFYFSALCRSE